MGRKKEFDNEAVLEKAAAVFWKQGYEGTSLKDLLKEMDILNGSFYHAYGNKQNLFLAALQNYEKEFSRQREEVFAAKYPFKKKLRFLFQHLLDRQKASICPKGCFLFNSVSSDSLQDIEFFKLIRSGVRRFEDFLENQITIAKNNSELPETVDAKVTASLLVTYTQGIMKLSYLDYDDEKFRRQTEYFFTSLNI